MKSKKRYKSASEFKKLLKEKEPQKVKEEYMLGQHSDLTERQLRKICELSGTGRGGCAFKYKKNIGDVNG